MNAIIAMIVAAVPNAILAIAGKLLTQNMVQAILERVLVAGVKKAASLTTNTVDDELAAEVARRLKETPGA